MVRLRLRHEQGAKFLLLKFFASRRGGHCGNRELRREPALTSHSVSIRYGYNVASVIRDFEPEDFETLWRMDQACFPAGIAYSKQELKAYIRHRGAFTLVAIDPQAEKLRGSSLPIAGPPVTSLPLM